MSLRPWTLEDGPVLEQAYADPAIQQWHCRTMPLAEAREWITAKHESWSREVAADWAVQSQRLVVGRVGFRWTTLPEATAEIAYWTLPAHRGHGYSALAVRALTAWGVEHGLHRIELRHAMANERSCRVALRCGFEIEGTATAAMLHPDGWHDTHVHALVAADGG